MKKIKIEIKNGYNGMVMFEYEKEDNTIKDTVIEAVRNGVKLGYADLVGANLSGAYLSGANLHDAYLSGANLHDAYLVGANLGCANLCGANLSGANIRNANLAGAYIRNANLADAYVRDANLSGAYIRDANLSGAYLVGVSGMPYFPLACPSDGAFIGWKKVEGEYLVKLLIPEDAKRCSATGRKCRCSKAQVLDITTLDETEHHIEVTNTEYKPYITYNVGEVVLPDSFDEDRWDECSHGIHFFINKQDAIDY